MAYLNGEHIPFMFRQTSGGNMEHVIVTEWNPQNVKGETTLDTVKEGQIIILEFSEDSYMMTRFKINLVDASGNTVFEAWTTTGHGQSLFDAGDHAIYRYNGEAWERIDVTNANQIFITDNAQLPESTPLAGLSVQRAIQDLYNSIGGANGSGGNAQTVYELVTTEEVLKIDTGYTPTSADGIVMVHFLIPANTAQTASTNFWISLSDSPNATNYIAWLSMFYNNACGVTEIIVPTSKEKFISIKADAATGSGNITLTKIGTEKPYDKTLKIGTSSSSVIFPVGTQIKVVKYGGGLV